MFLINFILCFVSDNKNNNNIIIIINLNKTYLNNNIRKN